MRQTDFSRLHTGSTANECYVRNGVVRRAKRTSGDECRSSVQFSSNGVYLCRLQTLCQCERRENRRQTLRHHTLTTAWTAHKQQIVSAGSCHFKSALHGRLSFHLAEIVGKIRLRSIKFRTRIHLCGLQFLCAIEVLHHIAQFACPIHLQLVHHRSLTCILCWHNQGFISQLAR